ncbi:tyrosinase family oxidase copper chaperone [Streptomyces sp. NPDC050738]|uniref:tyrosinase family oxidase copper chaperone n=1 Tax=Streptomyces sp. NPDC050738 TaxID=3154744 RepID=UPI00342E68D6
MGKDVRGATRVASDPVGSFMSFRVVQRGAGDHPFDPDRGKGWRGRVAPARRGVLQALSALSVTAFTGGALSRIVSTPRHTVAEPSAMDVADRLVVFDEMYGGHQLAGYAAAASAAEDAVEVFIDGRPLHLMRCARGGYVSHIDHYQSYPTPLATARAAALELRSARLAPMPGHNGDTYGGGRGVRP